MEVKFIYPDIMGLGDRGDRPLRLLSRVFCILIGIVLAVGCVTILIKACGGLIWLVTGRGVLAALLAITGMIVLIPVLGFLFKISADVLTQSIMGDFSMYKTDDYYSDCLQLERGHVRKVTLIPDGEFARLFVNYEYDGDMADAVFYLPLKCNEGLSCVLIDLDQGSVSVPYEDIPDGKEFVCQLPTV